MFLLDIVLILSWFNLVDVVLLIPIIATVIATLTFLLVFFSFYSKPWKLKGWLLTGLFFFIPWAGFTVLMRLAPNENDALWLLRLSFISSQISYYSSYRFHHLMVYKPTDNRIATFGLAALSGICIGLTFSTNNLKVVVASNKYYTDQFGPFLMLPNILVGTWAAYFTFKALSQMDAFALFYDDEGRRNTIPIFMFGGLIIIAFITMAAWFVQGGSSDSSPFILIIALALIFLGITYGINPTSKILAPQRLWSFLIVHTSGLPVYEHHFAKEERIGELALVAMAITASNTTIQANLNSNSPVDEISMEDRGIIIEFTSDLLFCLVVDHNSLQLQIEMEVLVNRIINHPEFTIPDAGGEYGKFAYVDDVIKEVFESKTIESARREAARD